MKYEQLLLPPDYNKWLECLIGCKATKNRLNEAMKSVKMEKLDWCVKHRKYPGPDTCVVHVQDEEGYIEGITGSVPWDLIVDNWGIAIAGALNPSGTTRVSEDVEDDASTTTSIAMRAEPTLTIGGWAYTGGGNPEGIVMRLGDGSAVSQGDVTLDSLLANSPQNAYFAIAAQAGYGSGVVEINGTSPAFAVAGETVSEVGIFNQIDIGAVVRQFMMMHFALNPTLPIGLGKSAVVTCDVTLA